MSPYRGEETEGEGHGQPARPTLDPKLGDPCDISAKFLERVEKEKKSRGWPALKKATEGAVYAEKLSQWKKGVTRPRAGAIALFCRFLGIGPEELELPKETCDAVNDLLGKSSPHPIEYSLDDAPDSPDFFAGRDSFLGRERDGVGGTIDDAYEGKRVVIYCLWGYAGEGKSSLARRWIERRMASTRPDRPGAVFWGSFGAGYPEGAVFERLRSFLRGSPVVSNPAYVFDLIQEALPLMRARRGRTILVLDGVENNQKPDGSLLPHDDLNRFLRELARLDSEVFCIITSRIPLAIEVEEGRLRSEKLGGLDPNDGLALLRHLRVNADDETLRGLVDDWQGHAWTLEQLGQIAAGDPGVLDHLSLIGESARGRARFLEFYLDLLKPSEKAVYELIATIRRPISGPDLIRLVGDHAGENPGSKLRPEEVPAIVEKLRELSILRPMGSTGMSARRPSSEPPAPPRYTTHALVREFAEPVGPKGLDGPMRAWHLRLCRFYMERGGERLENPRRYDLRFYLEALHHAARAGDYQLAWTIAWKNLSQEEKFVITTRLCAYDLTLRAFSDFFAGGDFRDEILVEDPRARQMLLRGTGLTLRSVGRLHDAVRIYRRSYRELKAIPGFAAYPPAKEQCSVIVQSLAELAAHMGRFAVSRRRALEGLKMAEESGSRLLERMALGHLAWAQHLRGEYDLCDQTFARARSLDDARDFEKDYYFTMTCIWQAEHARRMGRPAEAQKALEVVREVCRRTPFPDDISRTRRLEGELFSDAGEHDMARDAFEEAIHAARRIKRTDVLIEALLALGSWKTQQGDLKEGREMLANALTYARSGNYRVAEVDLLTSLAWADLLNKKPDDARSKATTAIELGRAINYSWGQAEAKRILEA